MRAAVQPRTEEISKREESIEVRIVPRYFLGRRPWILRAAVTSVLLIWNCSPAPAQTANWIGTTSNWFTGTNWSTGVVPSPVDDVVIDTSIFPPPVVNAPGATAQRVFVGGQFDNNTGIATTGVGLLSIAAGGQLVSSGGGSCCTFIGVGTGSMGGLSITNVGSSWTTTGPVLVGASGADGSFSVTDQATAENKIFLVGVNLADLSGQPITNGSGPSTGALTIADGAKITSTGGLDSDVPDAIGAGTDAIGNAIVTGAGSQWSIAQNLAIGIAGGTGNLTIENGGAVGTVGFLGVGVGIDPSPWGLWHFECAERRHPEYQCWRLYRRRRGHGNCQRVGRRLGLDHQWPSLCRRRAGSAAWARHRHGEPCGRWMLRAIGRRHSCSGSRVIWNLEYRCGARESAGSPRHARHADRHVR